MSGSSGVTTDALGLWRGVKPVTAASGCAITARLRTTGEDEWVLDAVAAHLGWSRRADPAVTSEREPLNAQLSDPQRSRVRRDRLNARRMALTAQSSARWANAIIAGDDDRYRLSRDAQSRDAQSRDAQYRRNRLAGMAQHTGIAVYAVNPAYTSTWGAQPWQRPYINVTRHQAAATVIGRRAQGHPARRRKGVTPKRPEDRPVRATNQTGPDNPQATTGTATGQGCEEPNLARQAAGVRGHPSRATVTPAQLANNDQLQLQRF